MIRTNFHVTQVQLDRLRALSEQTGLSVAELVRRAIDAYLDAKEQESREKPKK